MRRARDRRPARCRPGHQRVEGGCASVGGGRGHRRAAGRRGARRGGRRGHPAGPARRGTRTGRQVNLGTGAQVLRPGWTPVPADDPPVHGYADVEDRWYAMAALQNGGLAWSWVCGVLGLTPVELFDAAATVPTGAGGVVLRPFLTGERGGVAGPADRGGWTGLPASTTRAELARAAVEGVVFAVAAAADLLGGEGPVVLRGGGAAGRRPAAARRRPRRPRAVPADPQRVGGRCRAAGRPGNGDRGRDGAAAGPAGRAAAGTGAGRGARPVARGTSPAGTALTRTGGRSRRPDDARRTQGWRRCSAS